MYHSIDPSDSPISVSAPAFRRHVEWLASGRVRVVPLLELLHAPDDADAVALTFDDGFVNFGEIAAPLLRSHGLPATLFVVAEHAGGTNAWSGVETPGIPVLPLLDWADLDALARQGITIGAHTATHPRLDGVPAAELPAEIVGGAETIERRLGLAPTTFAYPYGAMSADAVRLVRERFAVGVSTELRPVGPADDRAALPRVDMYYLRGPGRLESWGSPAFRRRLWLRAQARRVRQYVVSDHGRIAT